jgi:hypothetical protein
MEAQAKKINEHQMRVSRRFWEATVAGERGVEGGTRGSTGGMVEGAQEGAGGVGEESGRGISDITE